MATDTQTLYAPLECKVLDKFKPVKAGDPGWDAVCNICNQLQADEKKDDSSWLARYLCAISHPCSDGYMQKFLNDCITDLYSDKAQEFGVNFYHHLHNYLKLSKGFSDNWLRQSHEGSEVLSALEYTLRMILANRCYARLYQWMRVILEKEPDKNYDT